MAQQGVQFIIGIILARLLVPEDYGLIGMVLVFAQIAYVLVESGLGYALVRTHDIGEEHKNTVFYSNLCISIVLYVILYFCSPLIADFFNQPSLTSIARVTFLAILFNALYIVPYNLLGRDLDYKTLTKINFGATTLSGASGIVMAIYGYGVWALVVQQTSYHFFRMILFHIFIKWKPKLMFSWNILKSYASFSVHMLGSSLLTVLFNNVYTFILGKLYPVKEVGFYTQGNKMSDTVNFTFLAILSTTYNLFAKIHNQIERVARILRTINQKVSIITLPLIIFMIIIAKPMFFLLFGAKWLDAVPYFQIICLANLFAPLYQINIHAINALGFSKSTFRIELTKRILIVISIVLCFVFNANIMTMLYFYALSCWIAFAMTTINIKKRLSIFYIHQLFDVTTGLWIAIIIGIGCYCCRFITDNLYALFGIECGVAIALFLLYILIFQPKLVQETKDMLHGNFEERTL